jgi:Flp pilus assembly protein TadB
MTAAMFLGLGVLLALPTRARPAAPASEPQARVPGPGMVERCRLLWAACAVVAGVTLLGGSVGVVVGAAGGVTVWVVVGRAEPVAQRRRRAQVARDAPILVDLVAVALEAGAAVATALELAAAAHPGAAGDDLREVATRLRLGIPTEVAWRRPADDPLATLGRAMVRAQASGASVASAAHQLADELTEKARVEVEDRARTVGVRAAVPLGLCLLPAFLVLGVVPLVAGAAGAITW